MFLKIEINIEVNLFDRDKIYCIKDIDKGNYTGWISYGDLTHYTLLSVVRENEINKLLV